MSVEVDLRLGASGAPALADTVAVPGGGLDIQRGLFLEGARALHAVPGSSAMGDGAEIDKDLFRAPQDALWRPHRSVMAATGAW